MINFKNSIKDALVTLTGLVRDTKKDIYSKQNEIIDNLFEHSNNNSNPHEVSKAQIGLGNVDNTADIDKPVSDATKSAIITATTDMATKTYVNSRDADLATLTTTDKTSLVKAINEVVSVKADKEAVALSVSNLTDNKVDKATTLNGYGITDAYTKSEIDTNYGGVKTLYDKNVEAGAGANGWTPELIAVSENVNQRQINDGLDNIAQLSSIKNPRNGQRVYVKSVAAHYIYNSNLTTTPNGVTIVGKWEMENKDAYFASWFATPDVEEDQSLKLQAGLDYATSKGASFIIDGTYWVKAKQSLLGTNSNALLLRTNSVTVFTPKGHLKLITENASGYNMILARQIDNYILIRPKLTGDRRTNTGGAGEWGYGLTIYESSNGYIEKPYIRDMWGDGLYIGKAWGTSSNDVPTNITVIEPNIKGCRRNGIALTSWDNVRIVRPVVSNVGDYDGITGTWPKAAIDVEPEFAEGSPPARGINGIIEDPVLLDSYAGFYFYGFPNDANFDLHVKGITTLKGIGNTGTGFFHGGANCTGLIKIDHLNYLTAPYLAMSLGWNKLSKLKLLIERIDYPGQTSFVIGAAQNGDFVGKKLGNVTINNINTSGFTAYSPPKDEEYLVDGYRFFISPDNKVGIGTYIEGTAAKVSGKDTYIQSSYRPAYAGWSTATDKMGNEIWLNTYSNPAGDTQIFFNASTDYRVLTIGLSNYTYNIGQGCNIQGVKLTVDGIAKTRMHTKTRGGWIKFQNIEGKDTNILDSYGVWTFS